MGRGDSPAVGTYSTEDATHSQAEKHCHEYHVSLSDTLEGIRACLKSWKAARHEGQVVLSGLSNALLLRTYVDKGRPDSNGMGTAGTGSSDVWGALANAGTSVSCISVATEARVRRLNGDLTALQDAMLAAAAGVRRHAQEARHRCFCHCFSSATAAAAAAKQIGEEGKEKRSAPTHDSRSKNKISGTRGSSDATRKDNGQMSAVIAVKVKNNVNGTASSACSELPADGDKGDVSESDAEVRIGGGYALLDVADAASEVAEMLLKEALVTATIAHEVCGCHEDRETLMVYAASWRMQPYIDARRMKELETMVAEADRARGGKRGGNRA